MSDDLEARCTTSDDVDRWKRELNEAGWQQLRATLWKSPSGAFYRGPYLAWTIMAAIQERTPEEQP